MAVVGFDAPGPFGVVSLVELAAALPTYLGLRSAGGQVGVPVPPIQEFTRSCLTVGEGFGLDPPLRLGGSLGVTRW